MRFIGHSNIRPRRLRANQNLRALVQEHHVQSTDFIYPLFICDHDAEKTEILHLPNVYRWPYEEALQEIQSAYSVGIRAVMLFPVINPNYKDDFGSYAYASDGLLQRFIRDARKSCPDMLLFADVALDPYTTHGHDGLIDLDIGTDNDIGNGTASSSRDVTTGSSSENVKNDETVEVLCKQAVSLAQSGIHFVCPSDMMDGRIGAIRHALDEHGFQTVGILSYCAKYASAFYGPFREALKNSRASPLDKRTYQMNPANSQEALREAELDIAEGADMLMIKPGVLYLDIISKIKTISTIPLVAYHVSGEYAMLKLASSQGILDEKKAVTETMLAFKRAGADLIVTYYAKYYLEQII